MPLKTNIKVIVSCSTKFWAFALAEQLEKHGMLHQFYTSYSSKKNKFMMRYAKRIDNEIILNKKLKTNVLIAIGIKGLKNPYFWNTLFDWWVAQKIKRSSDADVFIGWSGMSKLSIKAAKKKGMLTIVERGSAHIGFQNEVLKEEYKKFGIDFSIDERVIKKELEEYKLADYIAIPSSFVYKSFIEKENNEKKLIVNHYGASSDFYSKDDKKASDKFVVIYFGALMIRKGLIYLFEALKGLTINEQDYEVWFIGSVKPEVKSLIDKFKTDNWIFKGHINHSELAMVLSQGSIGVVPSIEDGFGMVVPQLLACNVPVIVSENTGSADLIENGKNGYIVPIRNAKAIAEKLSYLNTNRSKITEMKSYIANNPIDLSWDAYGNRYVAKLNEITAERDA